MTRASRAVLCFFWVGLCLIVAGCGASSGSLLETGFQEYGNGDVVGRADDGSPGQSIPGLPEGDSIIAFGPNCSGESLFGSTYRVQSDTAGGDKSLRLLFARLPHCDESCGICEEVALLHFVPIAPHDDGNPIVFTWDGQLANILPDMGMEITIREAGEFFSILMIVVRPDQLRVFRGLELLGVIQHDFREIHGVLVRISPSDGTFGVQVSGAGMLTPESSVDPCPFPNVVCGEFAAGNFDPASVVLRMQFTGEPPGVSVAVNPEYRVDNVRIFQQPP